jgi:signal transduction histidine kinase
MKRLSLRDRVTLASTLALAFALAIGSIAGNALLSNRFEADADNALRNRAAAQEVTLDSSGGTLRVRESSNDAVLDEQSWVFDGARAIERPRASNDLQVAAEGLRDVADPTFRTVGEVRLFATPAYGKNATRRVGTIVVGVSLQPYEHTEHVARVATLLLDLFALLAAAITVRWSVGRALQPVKDMTDRAAEWSEHDLHRRFEMGEPFDEITGLAATLDSLLGRIDAAMRREQRLTAEIAHELRTPLSGVRAEAELALRDADGRHADILRNIISGTDRLNGAIETLLATHVSGDNKNHWCDPRETVIEVVEASRGAALARDVALDVIGPADSGRVETDKRVLAQTLAPLVENSIRHARANVTISLGRTGGTTVISIRDDGDGVSPDEVEAIFEAGVSGTDGAGLGLPLARRLASSFGAELVAVASTTGGEFELRIPASN